MHHCFVASFGQVSHFSRCLINLTCNKNICCGLKKCGALIGWFVVTSCEFDEKRATKPKFKVDPCSTFCNNFLQTATNVFVARQVDHARWKTGNINKNLQRNNVARQIEGFCVSCFAALSQWKLLNCIKLLPLYPVVPFLILLHMLYTLKNSYWK